MLIRPSASVLDVWSFFRLWEIGYWWLSSCCSSGDQDASSEMCHWLGGQLLSWERYLVQIFDQLGTRQLLKDTLDWESSTICRNSKGNIICEAIWSILGSSDRKVPRFSAWRLLQFSITRKPVQIFKKIKIKNPYPFLAFTKITSAWTLRYPVRKNFNLNSIFYILNYFSKMWIICKNKVRLTDERNLGIVHSPGKLFRGWCSSRASRGWFSRLCEAESMPLVDARLKETSGNNVTSSEHDDSDPVESVLFSSDSLELLAVVAMSIIWGGAAELVASCKQRSLEPSRWCNRFSKLMTADACSTTKLNQR